MKNFKRLTDVSRPVARAMHGTVKPRGVLRPLERSFSTTNLTEMSRKPTGDLGIGKCG